MNILNSFNGSGSILTGFLGILFGFALRWLYDCCKKSKEKKDLKIKLENIVLSMIDSLEVILFSNLYFFYDDLDKKILEYRHVLILGEFNILNESLKNYVEVNSFTEIDKYKIIRQLRSIYEYGKTIESFMLEYQKTSDKSFKGKISKFYWTSLFEGV